MKIKRRIAVGAFERSGDADSLDPLLRRIYENREVVNMDQATYSLKQLYPPDLLSGLGGCEYPG